MDVAIAAFKHLYLKRKFSDDVSPDQPLQHAIDLVRRIKHSYHNTSIAVGGHPDIHPESMSLELDIEYLREKVAAGADFIITQPCFSSSTLIQFIKKCRDIGIPRTVPILPGIFVPSSFDTLNFFRTLCKIKVPAEQLEVYETLKDDPQAFHDYAVERTIELMNDLFERDDDGDAMMGVHFFTMNNFELMRRVVDHFEFK